MKTRELNYFEHEALREEEEGGGDNSPLAFNFKFNLCGRFGHRMKQTGEKIHKSPVRCPRCTCEDFIRWGDKEAKCRKCGSEYAASFVVERIERCVRFNCHT